MEEDVQKYSPTVMFSGTPCKCDWLGVPDLALWLRMDQS